MHKIDGSGNVAGAFVAEDPQNNQPGTLVTPDWLNAVQNEITNVILAPNSGITTLDKANNAQLRAAILSLISSNQTAGVKYIAAGGALPTQNIGPIYHDDYSAIMTWRTIGTYTGYASINLGSYQSFSGTLPVGLMAATGAAFNASTYPALAAYLGSAILPNILADDAIVQANGNAGTRTDGQMPAHAHNFDVRTGYYNDVAGTNAPTGTYPSRAIQGQWSTLAQGSGTRNLASGMRANIGIKY